MSYARQTLKFSSIAPDLIPQDAPGEVWDIGNNVFFHNGESVRVAGDAPTLPGAAVTARTCVFITGTARQGYWVYATDDGIYAHDGSQQFDITPAGGWSLPFDPTTVWTSCLLNQIAYVNASDRDPVYWAGDPATPCQPLPDWPALGRCLALRSHKSFLFAIGFISEGRQRVRWSDAAEAGTVPQEWAPSASNLAGFLDLPPNDSPCLDGVDLRDSFFVYKQESIWSFDFVGGNAVFRARIVFAEHGAAATNAITRGIDDVHLFVGDDGDCYLTDGVKVQSVLDGRAQRTFYADFSANKDRVFSAVTLAREKIGLLIYPRADALGDTALIFDFPSGDIGFRDTPDVTCAAEGGKLTDPATIGNSWDSDTVAVAWDDDASIWSEQGETQTLDDVIIAGDQGFFAISDPAAQDFASGEVVATLSKSGLSFGAPQRHKLVSRIWPKIEGDEGQQLQFRIGGQEVSGGPIELADPVTYTIGQDYHLDTFVQGRFISVQITSVGGGVWRLGSIDFELKAGSMF